MKSGQGQLPKLTMLVCGIAASFASARAGSIAQSAAFPVTNQTVTLTVSADLLGTPIAVAGPLGTSELAPDAQGQVLWTPTRYGKYTLTCGDATNAIWVTARPMKFHWWSCTTAQKNVTEVMQRDAAWQARGVTRVDWTGGDYLAAPENGGYTTAQQWHDNWTYAYNTDGMALDEMWCENVARTNAMLEAISMVRAARGPSYSINVWSAGIGSDFAAGAANFKTNNVTFLIEDYYGGWNNHKSRWDKVRSYGLQNQAISGIWPGTSNLTNVVELRNDVALVRLAAPEANGIAIFAPIKRVNGVDQTHAYTPNDAPTLLNDCDQAIEDYFLKPLIHLAVNSSAQLVVWNLGNEDAAGFSLQLLNSGNSVVQTIDLSTLVANGKQTLAIPAGAVKAKVINPPDTANLYAGNSQYSNGIYPLLVPGRYTWTNANGDHLWSTFSSWNPNGPPPGNIDAGNYAYFDGGTSAPAAVTAPNGETSVSSVQFTTAGWTINGNATTQNFYTYGVSSSGAGTNTINIGLSARDVVPASFTVGQDNTLVMNGLIGAVRNNGGLVKSGTGTLTVTHANTFTGGTSINAGTLRIGGAGTLGNGAYAGTITNNGALVCASTAANQTFSGAISGAGSLTQAGTGTLTLSGNNSYGGATTVDAGKLVFSKTAANNPGPTVFTVNPGATLQINNTGATWDGCANGVTVNGGTASLGGSGTVVYYGAGNIRMTGGSLTLASNWAPYGNLTVTTQASPTTATIGGTAGYQYNPALNFNVGRGTAASDLTVSLALGGNGKLTKNGGGILQLSGTNNYAGATGLNGGTLLVNGSTSATSSITVTATATLGGTGNAAGSVTAAGTISPGTAGTGTLATGAATLTGTYACEIDGAAADRWNVSGNLNLTGATLAVSEIAPASFTSAVIAKYTGSLTGAFAPSPALPAGVTVQYDAAAKEIRLIKAPGYETWLAGFTFAPGGDITPTGDPDGDGLSNRQEYAFGLNPIDGSSMSPIIVPVNRADATFTYVRRKPALTGLTYRVWTSPDLATWTEDSGARQTATDQGDNQSVQVTLSAPAPLAAPKLFVRCTAE